MSEEILQEQENQVTICHINSRTKPLFRSMLNQLGDNVKLGKMYIKYGDALEQLDNESFVSLFNRWITKCCEKNIMRKTLASDCEKQLEWSQELSDVERAFQGMEVLKEML